MKQLLDLYQLILDTGIQQPNRTGIDTLMVPGVMLRFDLREGFPAVTTKQLAFKAVKGELLGFLRGYTNAADFRALGCRIWDQNANENKVWLANSNRKGEDDLGDMYGKQWTDWTIYTELFKFSPNHDDQVVCQKGSINQVQEVLKKLKNDPTDRRMIISGWNPPEFSKMALLPCHVLYQFLADNKNKVLHLCMYQRSADSFLGVPFNIASASLFLSIMAKLSGFTAGTFTHFLADAHIYMNHIEQVKEQISRTPFDLPKLELSFPDIDPLVEIDWAFKINPEHINLVNYVSHDK